MTKEQAEEEAETWLRDDRDDAESLAAMLKRVVDAAVTAETEACIADLLATSAWTGEASRFRESSIERIRARKASR